MVASNFYDVIKSDDYGDNDFRFNDTLIQCVCVCVCAGGAGCRRGGGVGGVGGGVVEVGRGSFASK